MNFRLTKLAISLTILSLGMLIELTWFYWHNFNQSLPYPDSSLFFKPEVRYSDLFDNIRYSTHSNPYDVVCSNYFPAAYLFLFPLHFLSPPLSLFLCILLPLAGLFLAQYAVLQTLPLGKSQSLVATIILVGLSYPLLMCIDRGNIEIMLAVFIASALIFYQKKYYYLSILLIGYCATFKLYPVILFALFIRPLRIQPLLIGIAFCISITLIALSTFKYAIWENALILKNALGTYHQFYNIENNGLGNDASPWNLIKVFILLANLTFHISPVWPISQPLLLIISKIYFGITMVGLALVLYYIIAFECEWLRQAVLLILFMMVATPGGAEYKLIHVNIALACWILIPNRRPADLFVTFLLGLSLISYHEVFLTALGPTDSGAADVSLGIVIKPLCLLAAILLIYRDAWCLRNEKFSQEYLYSLAQ